MKFFKAGTMVLTPDTQAFVEKVADGPALSSLAPAEARKMLLDMQAQSRFFMAPAEVRDVEIQAGPSGRVPTRIVRPEGTDDKLPVIFYIHGGGWVMGNRETHERLIRELAVGAQAAVVFPDYTPSPEAHYPAPLEEMYAVLTTIEQKGDACDLDPSRIALAGDSVGGNMAAAIALMVKERGGPRIAFQLLLYPVTSAEMDSDSYKIFSDGPWLTRDSMRWFWDAYCPDKDRRDEALVSPLKADIERLRDLPPTLVITAENDVLRDEGEAYARKLMAAGVPVAAIRYLGTLHDFMMLNALADTAPAKAALRQSCIALREALHS